MPAPADTISPDPPEKRSLDYEALREEALGHLRELAGAVWTDHNAHDPGITILEALIYALTELGHRVRMAGDALGDHADSDPFGEAESGVIPFFDPESILPCGPLTPDDYRRALLAMEELQDTVDDLWISPETTKRFPSRSGFYSVHLAFREANLNSFTDFVEAADAGRIAGKIPESGEDVPEAETMVITGTDSAGEEIPIPENRRPFTVRNDYDMELSFPYWDDPGLASGWFDQGLQLQEDARITVDEVRMANSKSEGEAVSDFVANLTIQPSAKNTEILELERLEVRLIGLSTDSETKIASIEATLKTPAALKLIRRFKANLKKVSRVRGEIAEPINRVRNLCEVFPVSEFKAVGIHEIGIKGGIRIAPWADPKTVIEAVYRRVNAFLAPPVRERSLREWQDAGMDLSDIYDGPLPTAGRFLVAGDSGHKDAGGRIFVSDILGILMGIEGIEAVTIEKMAYFKRATETSNSDATGYVTKSVVRSRPRLSVLPSRTALALTRRLPDFSEDSVSDGEVSKVLQTIYPSPNEKQPAESEADQTGPSMKAPVKPKPAFPWRDLAAYHSVRNDFPAAYRLGVTGSGGGDPDRDRKTRQLESYLEFFEEILADSFSRLATVPELFAVSRDDGHDESAKLLDHLLARFGESLPFSESAPKRSLLEDLPSLGSDRGLASTGTEPGFSGLQRRLARLLNVPIDSFGVIEWRTFSLTVVFFSGERNPDAEVLIEQEAPAHLNVDVFWSPEESIRTAYDHWRKNPREKNALRNLITEAKKLYPEESAI